MWNKYLVEKQNASFLVDNNKKKTNVNLHEICISKIKHPLSFCFLYHLEDEWQQSVIFVTINNSLFFAHRQQQKHFKTLSVAHGQKQDPISICCGFLHCYIVNIDRFFFFATETVLGQHPLSVFDQEQLISAVIQLIEVELAGPPEP